MKSFSVLRQWILIMIPVLLIRFVGCKTTNPLVIPSAILSTAVATGFSAARRAEGECYTWCERGTVCNPRTGFCEPLPCRGECKENERCDTTGMVPRCVPHPTIEADIVKDNIIRSPEPP